MSVTLAQASQTIEDAAYPATCRCCFARKHSICADIDPEELTAFSRYARRVQIPAGKLILEQGDPTEYLFVVTEGCAKLSSLMQDGRKQIIGFATEGNIIGLANTERSVYSAEAITPCRLCRFTHEDLLNVPGRFDKIVAHLFLESARELAHAHSLMLLLGRKTAREKLASFLLECRSLFGHGKESVTLPMTRTDIADYLGLTIETVCRTLREFQREKLIAVSQTRNVNLLNGPSLANLAQGRAAASR